MPLLNPEMSSRPEAREPLQGVHALSPRVGARTATAVARTTHVLAPDTRQAGYRTPPRSRVDRSRCIPGHAGRRIGGRARLAAYLGRDVDRYEQVRNEPAADATSKLSPYLRFGCISANELVHKLAAPGAEASAPELVRQVAWRDFFLQLLAADPSLAWRDLRPTRSPSLTRSRAIRSRRGVRAARACRWSMRG